MSKDELNLPEGLKMSLISRHTLNIFKKIYEGARAHVYIYCKLKQARTAAAYRLISIVGG
jgi:hypothetical protein